MSTRLWQRVQDLFDQVLERPPGERAAFLDAACGGDAELRQAVDDLLAADQDDGTLLPAGATGHLLDALNEETVRPWLGRRLGSYRVVDILGQGGMGAVFLAERSDAEFEMQVAIKVLPLWMSNPDNLQRFRRERQILARLEHPHIAHLVDGGTTQEGQPFLVMEYVQGCTLTEHCEAEALDLRLRVDLLRTVCSAVSYAHQQLVVHRDLKSSNILVTADGAPKLLDFGIAKLLDPDDDVEVGQPTATEARRLTPDYASPEQLAGKPLTTATDVYSLGILLFEVLTGRRPFARRGSSWSGLESKLEHQEAPLMSDGLQEASGAPSLPWRRQLAGDLDTIVAKALRSDPAQRYGSVHELAEDLRRYLDGLPVKARPAGWLYRTGKLLRRHALVAGIAVAGAVLVSGFSVVTFLQARQLEVERDLARTEQARAERVTRLLLDSFEQADPSNSGGESVTARQILDAGARQASVELRQQPRLAATMLHTIGQVQARLGLFDAAREQLDGALKQRRGLFGPEHPDVADTQHEWAFLQLQTGQLDEAEEAVRQVIALRGGEDVELADSLHLLAEIRRTQGERQDAIDLHRQALDVQRQALGAAHPDYVAGLTQLAEALRLHGSSDEAETHYQEALDLQQQLYDGDHPVTASILGNLARLREKEGDLDGAVAHARGALEMNRRLYDGEHPSVAASLSRLAGIERLRGEPEQALRHHQEALVMLEGQLGPVHPRLAPLLHNIALLYHRDLHQPQDAVPLYRRAIDTLRSRVGEEHISLAFFRVGLGSSLSQIGQHAEAEAALRQALRHFSRLSRGGAEGRNAAVAKSELAAALLRQGRLEESAELAIASHAVLLDKVGPDHRFTQRATEVVQALQEQGAIP